MPIVLAHPPDPRAISVSAAVLAGEVLVGLLEVKPTPTSLGDVQTISALEVVDGGVLVVTLRLLENRRPLAFRELGQGGKWPQRTPPIAPMRGMGESLAQLRHSGFLTVTQRSVDYGPRTIEIARERGIELTETKEIATA